MSPFSSLIAVISLLWVDADAHLIAFDPLRLFRSGLCPQSCSSPAEAVARAATAKLAGARG